jgi:hypothetical protein
MAGINNPVRARLEQIHERINQVLDGRLNGPARRAEAKAMLTEAVDYILSNQLDKYADRQRIGRVRYLRDRAETIKDELAELGADDNAPGITDMSNKLTAMGRILQHPILDARDALPVRAQPPRGGRKTRKGKSRSRRARYSRRR